MPSVSCHTTTSLLSSVAKNNSAAVSVVLKIQNRPNHFSSENTISISQPQPDKMVFSFIYHLCLVKLTAGGRRAVYRYTCVHTLKIFLVQCLYICVTCRCLSTVPTGCTHGFSVPVYLHNSTTCQASK